MRALKDFRFRFSYLPMQSIYGNTADGWIGTAIVGLIFVVSLTLALILRF